MILFVAIAAAMCAAACLIVLRPLLWLPRKTEVLADPLLFQAEHATLQRQLQAGVITADAFADARDTLARRLLQAVVATPAAAPGPRAAAPMWRAVLMVLLFIPLLALPVYWKVGTPAALRTDLAAAADLSPAGAIEQMRERIRALEERLAKAPQDAAGWSTLGRSYAALGEYRKAADAYARAEPLAPQDAQMLADYADALAMAQERKLQGEPLRLLKRALAADPDNIKALLLAGTADFESGDYKNAVALWERVKSLAPQDTELIASLQKSIDEASVKSGAPATSGKAATPSKAASVPAAGAGKAASVPAAGAGKALATVASAGEAALSGRVTLSGALQGRVSPDDAVFIFARAAAGPRMPLAAMKKQVRDLPFDFKLDDSMAMAPQFKLSSAPEVILTARISKSGDPVPKPGDFEGNSAPLKIGTAGIKLEISEAVK